MTWRVHGGADARGRARWDFSTCANAAGPCPTALAAVQAADATRYPDPAATAVRQALAALHGVEPARILPAASASEFIQRITAVTGRLWPGAVRVPKRAYGDYALAATAWGRTCITDACAGLVKLAWHADPTSPLGQDGEPPGCDFGDGPVVLDAVYAPLRLHGDSAWTTDAEDRVFVLHSPNKALGLTGVRGAYAVAPASSARADWDAQRCCAALEAAAPSWPLSAHAEAMLLSWATPAVQDWVAASRVMLAAWKADLVQRLSLRGFSMQASVTPYMVVQPPRPVDLEALRAYDVAVRDTTSFGLAGWWRVSAQPPSALDALERALDGALS